MAYQNPIGRYLADRQTISSSLRDILWTKVAFGAVDEWVEVNAANPLPVRTSGATPTVTCIEATASEALIVAANAARRLPLLVKNDSPQRLYLKYGTGITPWSYTDWVEPGATWAMPGGIYTGAIYGLWKVNEAGLDPSGRALVTDVST